ncbi:MAG TPA: PRC-barrel domain-containing protein [Blastocatellia bacterium]|nr:PRC-barrel domain-containing protein [Blastocatellia bacterium]
MLINAQNLKGAAIIARDGAIGEIDDFYFDDEKWTVRYLVVDTGSWLFSRKVLISPISIEKADEGANQVFVSLTRDQVKDSPDIDTRKPVSRQHETAFMDYYGYPYYWGGPYLWGDAAFPATLTMPPAVKSQIAAAATARQRESEESYDERLRSVNEVNGYNIAAVDGEIGHVDDFIIDDEDWSIRFIVIKTGGWLSGRKTLVAPRWIEGISWDESKMFVSLTMDQIASNPEYDENSSRESREGR